MMRTVRLGLVFTLLGGIPGRPFYAAFAQTLPSAPVGPVGNAAPLPPGVSAASWRAHQFELVIGAGLPLSPLAPLAADPLSSAEAPGLRGASAELRGQGSAGGDVPVLRDAPVQAPYELRPMMVFPGLREAAPPPRARAAVPGSRRADGGAAGAARGALPHGDGPGETLIEDLRGLGSYWTRAAPGLNAAGAEDASLGARRSFDEEAGRPVEAARPSAEQRGQGSAGAFDVGFTWQFRDGARRAGLREGEWKRLRRDLSREVAGGRGARAALGRAGEAGIRKFRWLDRNLRLFFRVDADARTVTLLDVKRKAELVRRGEDAFYDELADRAAELGRHLLRGSGAADLKRRLLGSGRAAPSAELRGQGSAGGAAVPGLKAASDEPEVPSAELQGQGSAGGATVPSAESQGQGSAVGASAPDPAAGEASGLSPPGDGLAPPKLSFPRKLSAKFYAAYWGSVAATAGGLAAASVPFLDLPLWGQLGTLGLAGLGMAVSLVRRLLAGNGTEGQVGYDDSQELKEGQAIVDWLVERLGRDAAEAPRLGHYMPGSMALAHPERYTGRDVLTVLRHYGLLSEALKDVSPQAVRTLTALYGLDGKEPLSDEEAVRVLGAGGAEGLQELELAALQELDEAARVWGRPAYNFASWGHRLGPKAEIAAGEAVLLAGLEQDWRYLAGPLAHELGHVAMGDFRRYSVIEWLSGFAVKALGISGLADRLTNRRPLPGERPWKDRFSLGVAGSLLVAGLSQFGLASLTSLLFIPAAWALVLAGLALQQTYLRIQELRADAFSAALTHPSWMMGYLLGIREPGAVETRSLRERIFSTHPHYQDRLDALDPTGELRDSR